jgi:helix-turn-helix protein
LGRRARTPQSAISRIEREVVSPTADTLERLLKQCGAELGVVPRPGDGVDRTLIRERLRLSPSERIREAEREWRETEEFGRAIRRGR